jgi:hypothetical protein
MAVSDFWMTFCTAAAAFAAAVVVATAVPATAWANAGTAVNTTAAIPAESNEYAMIFFVSMFLKLKFNKKLLAGCLVRAYALVGAG